MDQDSIDIDDQHDLADKIREFVSKDQTFRNPKFDPSPYLIKILKQRQANQDLMIETQSSLVSLQNQAQQLIEQIAQQKSTEFIKLSEIPQQYGQQLEKLKSNISNVKKKVKQTKSHLLITQKDIKQIHLNCIYNKLIYKKLKNIEIRLNQYQAACLALKNKRFLECAENIPLLNQSSILESAIGSRFQNLKLTFLSQSFEQIRQFLYFTTKIILPTSNILIERATKPQQQILEAETYKNFYKRYQLFKKANYQKYLTQIWNFNDYQQKLGRIGIIEDIIKGIIRVGKSSEFTENVQIDRRKSISNIFLAVSYFLTKEYQEGKTQNGWFTSPSHEQMNRCFLETLFCIIGALIRKFIIICKMCNEYHISQLQINIGDLLILIKDELVKLLKLIYFPQLISISTSYEQMYDAIVTKIKNVGNYIYWPYFKKIIQKSMSILILSLKNLELEGKNQLYDLGFYMKSFKDINLKYFQYFHQHFMKTVKEIFESQGRKFLVQNFHHIVFEKHYKNDELQFFKSYVHQQRKSIKQFIKILSFISSIEAHFLFNNFQQTKYKKYICFLITFFYLTLNYNIYKYLISKKLYEISVQIRNRDSKVKAKQKGLYNQFDKLVDGVEGNVKMEKRSAKYQENQFLLVKNINNLKAIKGQLEMLFVFSMKKFQFVEEFKSKPQITNFYKEIEKHQPSNYEENLHYKMLRVWDQLIIPLGESDNTLNTFISATFKKLFELYLTINAAIFNDTGVY